MLLEGCIGHTLLKLKEHYPEFIEHLLADKVIFYRFYGDEFAYHGDRTYDLYFANGKLFDENDDYVNAYQYDIWGVEDKFRTTCMDVIYTLENIDAIHKNSEDQDDTAYALNDKGKQLLSLSDEALKSLVSFYESNYSKWSEMQQAAQQEYIYAQIRYDSYLTDMLK